MMRIWSWPCSILWMVFNIGIVLILFGLDPTVILVANSGTGASHAGCVTLTHG
jgi:hypothetical protein